MLGLYAKLCGLLLGLLWSAVAWSLDLSIEPIQPIEAINTNPAKVALGKKLFFDTRLSQDNSVSCAHCHDLIHAGGADHLKHSFGVEGREGAVNSPTVFNAALNFSQFWDGRAATLEEQVNVVVTTHAEMSSTWAEVLRKLRKDKSYQKVAAPACPQGLDANCIRGAIAEYEKTLLTLDSRFDQYLRGNESAITAEEKHGYHLFKSYGCVACHQGRNVGGNLYQVLGVIANYFDDFPDHNKASLGRFNVTGDEEDKHKFKVPSLRLVVLTSPYFHDGRIEKLDASIRSMGKYQLGRQIPDQDIASIILFLYTLPGIYQGKSLEPMSKKTWSNVRINAFVKEGKEL